MDSLQQTLSDILSSPEKLDQVMKIAGEFLGSSGGADTEEASGSPASPPLPAGDASDTVSALLGMLGGSQNTPAPTQGASPGAFGNLDPKLMSTVMQVLNIFSKDDDRVRLLLALKPHLRSERAERIDRAVQILRISEAVRTALHSLTGGDRKDVQSI